LGRETGFGGIGVDVFDRGEECFLIIDEDFPAAFRPRSMPEVQGFGCGAFELVDDILNSVLRGHDEYMHMVVHYCAGGDVQL